MLSAGFTTHGNESFSTAERTFFSVISALERLKYFGEGTSQRSKHFLIRGFMVAFRAASYEWHENPSFSPAYETEAEKSVPAVKIPFKFEFSVNSSAKFKISSFAFKSISLNSSARKTLSAFGFASTTTALNPSSFAERIAGRCISPAPKINTEGFVILFPIPL